MTKSSSYDFLPWNRLRVMSLTILVSSAMAVADNWTINTTAAVPIATTTATTKVGIGVTSASSVKNMLDVKGGAVIGSGYAGVSTAATDGLSVQGNVGIGIAVPTAKLDVVGNFKVSGLSYLTGNAYLSSNLYLDGGFGAYLKSTAVGTHAGQSIQIYADNSVLSATFAPTGVTVPGKLTVSGITTQTGRVNVNGATDAVNYWMNVKNGKIATSGGNPIYSFGVGDPASQVAGDPTYSAVYLVHTGTNAVLNSDGGGVPSAAAKPLLLQTKGITAISIGTDQKVGISNTSPQANLHVGPSNGSGSFKLGGIHSGGAGITLMNGVAYNTSTTSANSAEGGFLIYTDQDGVNLSNVHFFDIGARDYADPWNGGSQLRFLTSDLAPSGAPAGMQPAAVRMVIDRKGNVGIGQQNPSERLDVNGNLKVTGSITGGDLVVAKVTTKVWSIAPDFVFEKDYDLKPLAHVDEYVKKNKHLPEIPSAKEIHEKGIDLAEMNMKLLRKVEELTLYSITQEKKIDDLTYRLEKVERKR